MKNSNHVFLNVTTNAKRYLWGKVRMVPTTETCRVGFPEEFWEDSLHPQYAQVVTTGVGVCD
eukprot:4395736-Pyramimonas_sp.AAC.1